jgi:hypothetical protein
MPSTHPTLLITYLRHRKHHFGELLVIRPGTLLYLHTQRMQYRIVSVSVCLPRSLYYMQPQTLPLSGTGASQVLTLMLVHTQALTHQGGIDPSQVLVAMLDHRQERRTVMAVLGGLQCTHGWWDTECWCWVHASMKGPNQCLSTTALGHDL